MYLPEGMGKEFRYPLFSDPALCGEEQLDVLVEPDEPPGSVFLFQRNA